ncbi:MAG: SDR family oxidoreductase [Deltaproteobacteria bacterium]|nr:SDR family oxidoreductase [Deltaproteobacteria bacterium]
MRRALITGTTSGIGYAIARRFADRGQRVIGLARSAAPDLPQGYRHVRGDITDPDARDAAVRASEWIDLLVLNAGVCRPATLDDEEDPWDHVMDVNLNAPHALLRQALPILRPGGAVVFIGSTLSLRGRAGYAAYCASKHGLLGLMRASALELAPRGIRVNAVCPGWTETPMARADLERSRSASRARAEAEAALPLGRFVDPDEVAELVAFLASGHARSITGQAYEISGGEGV